MNRAERQQKLLDDGPDLWGRYLIEQPHPQFSDEKSLFFLREITHSGAQGGVRLTFEEVAERLTEKLGPGELVSDDGKWYWKVTDICLQ